MFKYTKTCTPPINFFGVFSKPELFFSFSVALTKKNMIRQKFSPTKSVQIGQSDGLKPLWYECIKRGEIGNSKEVDRQHLKTYMCRRQEESMRNEVFKSFLKGARSRVQGGIKIKED